MAYVGIGADGRPTDPLKVSERYHPSLDDPGIDPETGRTIAWIGWACDSPRANKSLLPAGRCYLPPDVYRRLPAVVTAMAVDRDSGDPGMRPTISYPSVAEAYADLRAAMASAAPPADPIDPTAVLTSPTPPPAERVVAHRHRPADGDPS